MKGTKAQTLCRLPSFGEVSGNQKYIKNQQYVNKNLIVPWYIDTIEGTTSVRQSEKKGDIAERDVTTTGILFHPLTQDPGAIPGSFCLPDEPPPIKI